MDIENTEATPEAPQDAAPPPEGQPEPQKVEEPPKPKAEPLSPKLAALAKKEAALRKEQDALKAEREAIQREKEALEQRRKLKGEDIDAWLKEEGLSYEEITELKLTGKKAVAPKSEDPPHPKVLELQQQLEDMTKREQERVAAENEARARAYQHKVVETVKAAGEQFELVNALGEEGHGYVWGVIQRHARETGEILSPEDAARQVEERLEAELSEKVKRLLQTKKASGKLGLASAQSADPKPAVPEAESESGPRSAVPTLTNAHAAAAPSGASRDLTWEERKAKAKALLAGRG